MPVNPLPFNVRGGRSHKTSDVPDLTTTWTPVAGVTPGKVGAQAPAFLVVVPQSATSIYLAWAPATDIGNTNEYQISVRETSSTGTEVHTDKVASSAHSATVTGLTANTTYWVGVRALATTGAPAASVWVSELTSTRPGGAVVTGQVEPFFVVVVAPSSTTMRIVWVAPPEAGDTTHWNIRVYEGDTTGDVVVNTVVAYNTQTFDVSTGLAANTTYWVGVRGTDLTDTSPFVSQTITTPTAGGGATPAAPKAAATMTGALKSITFGGITSYYAALTWTLQDKPGVITGYRIERLVASQGNTNWLPIGEVIGDDELAYNDWTGVRGFNYGYRVVVFGPGGESTPKVMTGSVDFPSVPAPAKPKSSNAALASVTFGGVTGYYGAVTWATEDSPGNVTGFLIERSPAVKTPSFLPLATIDGAGVRSYNDWTVQRGVNYAYRVSAIGPGGTSDHRGNTDTVSVPAVPTPDAPAAPATSGASLKTLTFGTVTGYYGAVVWTLADAPGDVSGFEIQRSFAVQTPNYQPIVTVTDKTALSYNDWTVQRGVNYVYRVAAIGPGGKSGPTGNTDTVSVPAVPTPPSPDAPKAPATVLNTLKSITFGGITSYYVDIDWTLDASPGIVTGFEILRSFAVRTPNFLPIATITNEDVRTYLDWTVQRGVNYQYQVKAIGPGGKSVARADNKAVSVPAWVPPSAVTDLEATSG